MKLNNFIERCPGFSQKRYENKRIEEEIEEKKEFEENKKNGCST